MFGRLFSLETALATQAEGHMAAMLIQKHTLSQRTDNKKRKLQLS